MRHGSIRSLPSWCMLLPQWGSAEVALATENHNAQAPCVFPMVTFSDWNNALLRHFFDVPESGQLVWLEVSSDLLDGEFENLGGRTSFLSAVKAGPEWSVGRDDVTAFDSFTLEGRAIGLSDQWCLSPLRRAKTGYVSAWRDGPPYLPYLAILCLAWADQEADHGNDFYDRLEAIYPEHGVKNRLNRLHRLWAGVQAWCKRENGACGTFSIEPFGPAHVGIPRAHVVFTPELRSRLPALFSLIGEPTSDAMRSSYCEHMLGPRLAGAMRDEADTFGRYALARLREEFNAWDGVYDLIESMKGPQGQVATKHRGQLLLSLQNDILGNWTCGVVVAGNLMPGRYRFDYENVTYIADFAEGRTSDSFISDNGDLFDGTLLLAEHAEHENILLETKTLVATDDENGVWCVDASWSEKPIRMLTYDDLTLSFLERDTRPGVGELYVLVSPRVQPNWKKWQAANAPECDDRGVIADRRLYRIRDVGSICDDSWKDFPDGGTAGGPRKAEPIRFVAGTRGRRTSGVPAYLAQDPPIVIVEWPHHGRIEVEGASLERVGDYHGRDSRATATDRVFLVNPSNDGCNVIKINLFSDDRLLRGKRFALIRETSVPGTDHAVNRFGIATPELSEGWRWWADPPCSERTGEPVVTLPNLVLGQERFGPDLRTLPELSKVSLDILDLISHHGRLAYARLRDRMALRHKRLNMTSVVKNLAWLGHVDIETDALGRWTYLHAVVPTIHRLPVDSRCGGYFALSGTLTTRFCSALIKAAEDRAIPVILDRASCQGSVPPRLVLSGGIKTVREIIDSVNDEVRANAMVTDRCLASGFLAWAGSIKEWDACPRYHLKRPLKDIGMTRSYCPTRFTTKPGLDRDFARVSRQLGLSPDPVCTRLERTYLVKANESLYEYSQVNDRSYAKWLAHVDRMSFLWRLVDRPEPPEIAIPYEQLLQAVHVPMELAPPTLLSRALVMSSGLLPDTETSPAYAPDDPTKLVPFTPTGQAYQGPCLIFRGVPRAIASGVAEKLGGVLSDF